MLLEEQAQAQQAREEEKHGGNRKISFL